MPYPRVLGNSCDGGFGLLTFFSRRRAGFGMVIAIAALLAPIPALAASMKAAADWSGTWRGRYICAQGATGLTLTIRSSGEGLVTASFSFYPLPENGLAASGEFGMRGTVSAEDADHLRLAARGWVKRPFGYVTVDLDGRYDGRSGEYAGTVDGPGCSSFVLRRDMTS